MTTATYELTINRNELLSALVEFHKSCDDNQNWNAVRVHADSSITVDEEPSRCESPDEYYRKMPHTVTVCSGTGNGACAYPEDWSNDDGEIGDEQIDECVKKLEEAGYDVELV